MRDFKRMQNDPPEGVNGAPQDNDIMKWHAVIFGCRPTLPTSQPHEAHRSPPLDRSLDAPGLLGHTLLPRGGAQARRYRLGGTLTLTLTLPGLTTPRGRTAPSSSP